MRISSYTLLVVAHCHWVMTVKVFLFRSYGPGTASNLPYRQKCFHLACQVAAIAM